MTGRRRRGNGEGGLYHRADGRWEGTVTIRLVGNRQERKSVYGRTRREAAEKLLRLQTTLAAGLAAPNDRLTVGAWVDRWLEAIAASHDAGRLAYKTLTSYRHMAERCIRHPEVGLQRERLGTLNAARVQRWLDELAGAGVPPPSIGLALKILRVVLRAAERAELLQRANPASLVVAPAYRPRTARPFSGESASDFLAAIREDRLYALFLLDLTTALRAGELCGVTWAAIDAAERLLWVRQQVQRQKGRGLVVTPTKTQRSENPVPLTRIALRALEAHKARMREERLAMGTEWRGADDPGAPGAFVFVSPTGGPLEGSAIWRHFKRLLRETGTPDRTLHAGGRHTTATILRALGVPPLVIRDFLRHARLATTEGYAHGDLAEQHAAADQLDVLLGERLG